MGFDVGYGTRQIDGEVIELCSECGFDGRRYSPQAVEDSLRALRHQWREALGGEERLVRQRPSDDTWCAVEYGVHTRDTLSGLGFVATLFLDQDDPKLPPRPAAPADEVGEDQCDTIDPELLADEVGAKAEEIADLVAGLSPGQFRRPGSVGDIHGDVLGVVRHAVHDATHHVLDVHRGFAAILLRES